MHLLTEEIKSAEDKSMKASNEKSDNLDMLKAVLSTVTPALGHNAVASSILSLMAISEEEPNEEWSRLESICSLLKKVTTLLPLWYDGLMMVKFMLAKEHADVYLDDTARIVFEFVLLSIPASMIEDSASENHKQGIRLSEKLLEIKKTILRWCLKSLEVPDKKKQDQFVTGEPNAPVYESILDGKTIKKPLGANLTIMHCLLFLSHADSGELFRFLHPRYKCELEDCSHIAEESKIRAKMCIKYGRNVDDALIQMIVKAAKTKNSNIGSVNAIELIECILFNCMEGAKGLLRMTDCNIIWDLYALTEHARKPSNMDKEIPRCVRVVLFRRQRFVIATQFSRFILL